MPWLVADALALVCEGFLAAPELQAWLGEMLRHTDQAAAAAGADQRELLLEIVQFCRLMLRLGALLRQA